MSPEAQRIAIAEACGWKRPNWGSPDSASGIRHEDFIPDYLNDLNAMHEAEKVLPREQRQTYHRYLVVGLSLADADATRADFEWQATHANAAQRAEALLRTLGKWRDDA